MHKFLKAPEASLLNCRLDDDDGVRVRDDLKALINLDDNLFEGFNKDFLLFLFSKRTEMEDKAQSKSASEVVFGLFESGNGNLDRTGIN